MKATDFLWALAYGGSANSLGYATGKIKSKSGVSQFLLSMLAGGSAPGVSKAVAGSVVHVLDAMALPAKDYSVTIKPVQGGSGDPAPDNVRPISGWSQMVLTHIPGKNLLDPSKLTSKSATIVTGYVNEGFLLKKGVTYCLSRSEFNGVGSTSIYTKDGLTSLASSSGTYNRRVFYTPTEDTEVSFRFYQAAGAGGADLDEIKSSAMLEISDTVTDYEAYASRTDTPVSWQTEAGTVYGGALDVTTGVLTVTHANIASYAAESINEPWISSMDVYSAGGTPTTGAQVVYPLTTALTYQLTPTEIQLAFGENVLWVDTGDSAMQYYAVKDSSILREVML